MFTVNIYLAIPQQLGASQIERRKSVVRSKNRMYNWLFCETRLLKQDYYQLRHNRPLTSKCFRDNSETAFFLSKNSCLLVTSNY